MMVRRHGVIGVLWATLLAGCGDEKQQTTPAAPIPWEPEVELLRNLAPAFQIPRHTYEIRPPKGYRYEQMRGIPMGWSGCMWFADRSDGTASQLRVVLLPTDDDVKELHSHMTSMLSKRARDSRKSNIEYGTIAGIRFGRAEWYTVDVRGLMYVGMDNGKMIQISAEENANSQAEGSLSLADATARTFQRTD